MAFTVSDFEDLVRLLGEHPEWRERLRPLILGEELLELPSRMDRVEAALDRLAEHVDSLRAEVALLTAAVYDTNARMDRMDDRMGNIEAQLLEDKYERHLSNWFNRWLRKPERVTTGDLDPDSAADDGRISAQEQHDIEALDLMVRGIDRGNADGQLVVFAVEVSPTVNVDDVARVHSGAELLAKAGHHSRPFIGGYRVTVEAERLAGRLNVIVDLRRAAA